MNINSKNLLVVGCVRNVEFTFQREILNLNKAIKNFKLKSFLFIESDSTDNTLNILENCRNQIKNFRYVTLGKVKKKFSYRTEALAYCRNYYVSEINNNLYYKNFDYILVVDLDGINYLLNEKSIQSCFLKHEWDAVFANQKKAYFDIYALRHNLWSPNNCREELAFFDKFRKNRSYNYWSSIYSKMIEIPTDSEWIEVISAFGGAGIYKKKNFINNQYVGSINGNETCEHVQFNKNIVNRGGKLFICPQFINSGINEHTKKKLSLRYRLKFAIQSLL